MRDWTISYFKQINTPIIINFTCIRYLIRNKISQLRANIMNLLKKIWVANRILKVVGQSWLTSTPQGLEKRALVTTRDVRDLIDIIDINLKSICPKLNLLGIISFICVLIQ